MGNGNSVTIATPQIDYDHFITIFTNKCSDELNIQPNKS